MFSEFIPVSQEAFALLLHKNGCNNWMHDMNATSSDSTDCSDDAEKPGCLCTCLRSEKGALFTRRNGGWSEAGMEAFNSLCAEVQNTLEETDSDTSHCQHM
jgi:hypothetical protein